MKQCDTRMQDKIMSKKQIASKLKYTKPVLSMVGRVAKVTKGGTGSILEGNAGCSPTNDPNSNCSGQKEKL